MNPFQTLCPAISFLLLIIISGNTYSQDTVNVLSEVSLTMPDEILPPDLTLIEVKKKGEQRIVYWVHGLSGSEVSWKPVGPHTENQSGGSTLANYPSRRIKSFYPTYSEEDMTSGINDLHRFMEDKNHTHSDSYDDKLDNFIIAHSQGGLVARGVDREEDIDPYWEREFKGLVTFGSAHQGAQILNNGLPEYYNGSYFGGKNMIAQISAEACAKLSSGPVYEGLDHNNYLINFLINAFSLPSKAMDLTKTGCDFFGGNVLPFLLSDFTPSITKEYRTGASYLNAINDHQNNFPKLAFYGVEKEPVFWRAMNTMSVGPSNFPIFGAGDDSTHIDYKQLRAHYRNRHLVYESEKMLLSKSFGVPCTKWHNWVTNLANCTAYDWLWWKKHETSQKYKDGLNWIEQANEKWKVIIGARTTKKVVTSKSVICYCSDKCNAGWNTSFPVSNEISCIEKNLTDPCLTCQAQTYRTVKTVVVQKKSDGIVLAESAKNLPGATMFGDNRMKLKNTNHFQLRNSEETQEKLYDLFEGVYGSYFYTDER